MTTPRPQDNSSELFGELRSRLHQPSTQSWRTLQQLLASIADQGLRQRAVLYVAEHLRAWPDTIALRPDPHWLHLAQRGAPPPELALHESLRLVLARFTPSSWRQTLESLEHLPRLTQLTLGDGRRPRMSLAPMAGWRAPALRQLVLERCHALAADDLGALARARWIPSLRLLDISNGRLDTHPKLEALARWPLGALEHLVLQSVALPGGQLDALEGLELPSLRRLELGFEPLGVRGIEQLLGLGWLQQLEELHLQQAAIDAEALALLLDGLGPSLRLLNLRGNPLTPRGARSIARTKNLEKLETLYLSGASIGPEGARALARSDRLPALRVLGLQQNRIFNEGALELAGSALLGQLHRLELERNGIGPFGRRALLNAETLSAQLRAKLERGQAQW